MKSNQDFHERKDCIFHGTNRKEHVRYLGQKYHKPKGYEGRCDALNKLYCKEEDCKWFKSKEEYIRCQIGYPELPVSGVDMFTIMKRSNLE